NVARQDNPMFFKTGPGEYAEHDKFLGVSVPVVHTVAKQYATLTLEEIHALLTSPYNEERLLALFILVLQYGKADEMRKNELYQFYMTNIQYVNNWNLVDQSARDIMGAYLFEYDHDKDILVRLTHSDSIW